MSDIRMATLEVIVSGAEGRPFRRVRLNSRTTVGRDEDNDISLSDELLSRHHAEFQRRNGGYYIVDLGSTNGTFVNDVRVHGERMLGDGDVVTVGATSLMLRKTEVSRISEEQAAQGVVFGEHGFDSTRRTIRKAVAVDDLLREDRGLGVLCQVTNALIVHHPLPELFDKILEAILDSIPAQRTAIMLLEGHPATPILKATRTRGNKDMGDLKLEIIERALEGRDALLVRDIFEDTPPPIRPSIRADPIRSVMCAPLWSTSKDGGEGRLLGLIYLDSLSDGPPLTDRDLQILIMLANITATKIENARLFEESLQKRRIEEDMRIAAEIQSHLLPGCSPVVPGYRVTGTTEPCRMVGGDYFDFDYDGQSLLLTLADVSGKGSGAAMLMVALRATVRAHWRNGTLAEATCGINRAFHLSVPPDKYATFFVARLEPASGRLEYVNAGHNRPLLIQPNGQCQRLETGGTVLGAFPEVTYEQGMAVLEPGSCMLVFSDGISDAWLNQDEADRQLVKLVMNRKPGDVAALCTDIFGAAARAKDDRTLVFLERLDNTPAISNG